MNSLKPARRDFKDVRRGNTFRRTIQITGLDLNLVDSWLMKVRQGPNDDPVLTFSSSAGGISVDGGALILERSAAEMTIPAANYKYDLILNIGADKHTLMEGFFEVVNSFSV